jgi:hypothetical protein
MSKIKMKKLLCLFIFCFTILNCNSKTKNIVLTQNKFETKFDTINKTIHIFVALCDNKYQGIVPVPPKIGNGQDLDNNLYWGCGFGIRTYFKKSVAWKLLKIEKIDNIKLERLIFKHTSKNYYLVADAYDGQFIEQCTKDFLMSNSGQLKETIKINNMTIGIYGNSKLNAYIGHDGLMDFQLAEKFDAIDNQKRNCIILACVSKKYFAPHLQDTKSNPIVWTTGLMCPEAYTVHDAILGFINNESDENIRNRAALAYAKYQKCSLKSARNLLVTGF